MRFLYFSLIFFVLFGCSNNETRHSKLIHLIPEESAIIIKTNAFENLKSGLNNNAFFQEISNAITYTALEEKLNLLDYLNPSNDVLICFSKDDHDSLQFSVITKYNDNLFKTDSIPGYTEEHLSVKNKTITKSTINNNIIYSTVNDSLFFVSSSKALTEVSFNNKNSNPELEKIYDTTSNNKTLSILLNTKNNKLINSFFVAESLPFKSFTNYISVDVDLSQNEILINGITKATDSTKSLINVFKNTVPQENELAKITPSNSDGFISFTFDDFYNFEENLNTFNNIYAVQSATTLFDNVIEVGAIYESENKAVVLNSIDVIATKDALLSDQNVIETYRQIEIYNFGNPELFSQTFSPFITYSGATKYCVIDNFFVFANDLELIQNIIANYQNKTTLSERDYFKDIQESLSDESSLLTVVNASSLKALLGKNLQENLNMKFAGYKASALQFVYDNNFAHVNAIIKKSKTRASQYSVSEELNVKLDNDLLINPQLVTNHITKQKEVVVQDVNNNLYLISNSGKILWKKQLQGAVLGSIKQIDIYKNGRLQLAFATQHRVYVLDRNGKDVAPFPAKFNDEITQPLSVFDYDKNKNYRLLVTQGKYVLMYDVKAKLVKGFTFKSATNNINHQPQHFRIGRKDYITIKTENKLHILDRTGRTRITPKTSSIYSNQAVYIYKNKFTTTTKKGELISIDTRGNTAIQNLNLSDQHNIVSTSKTLITQTENKLNIKSNVLELDYGSYSAPKIFYINDKIYVALTDLQSQKVYLFDSQAKLLPNFPVYGNSAITLDNIDKDRNLEFVVKGEDNAIIIYKIN